MDRRINLMKYMMMFYYILGYSVLFLVDWRIATGILLVNLGINVENRIRSYLQEK